MSFLTKILPRKRPQNLEAEGEPRIGYNTFVWKAEPDLPPSPATSSRPRDSRRNTGSTLSVPSLQTPTSRTSISTTRSGGKDKTYNGPQLDAATKWLRTCCQTHRACTEMAKSTYRPSRLVDLGVDFDLKRLCLIESTPDDVSVEYLALSYCRGSNMPEAAMTFTSTLEENKIRIRRGKLPRTFRHFLEIAKQLGIRYTWIDSLCILQDDLEEWQREVSSLGRIFSGAVCTIAAESAKDCQGGIWLESRLKMTSPSGSTSPSYQDMTQEDNLRNYISVCDQRFHKNPLQSRGWPVQERELSHRVLHLTFAHILWECREMKMTAPVLVGGSNVFVGSEAGLREMGVEWLSSRPRAFDVHSNLQERHLSETALRQTTSSYASFNSGRPTDHDSSSKLLFIWRTIIEEFSARRFTRWTDRLPSLWGFVYELQTRLAQEYQSAIWGADCYGLLWTIQDNVPPSARERDNTPSWSWAAFRNPITYSNIQPLGNGEEFAPSASQIINLGTDFWGNDPDGTNSYSGLSLKSRVRWVSSIEDFQDSRYNFFREDSASSPMFDYSTSHRVLIVRVVVFLGRGAYGLILKPRKDSFETVFERIGMVGGMDDRWFDGGFDKVVTII